MHELFGYVTRSLRLRLPSANKLKEGNVTEDFGLNVTEEFVHEELGYISHNLLTKDAG